MSEVEQFKPFADRILVKVIEEDAEKKVGGLFIPTTAQDKPDTATVVAVGGGARDFNGQTHPVPVAVGDTIYFSKFAGVEMKFDLEDYLLLRESDIVGVVQ